MWISLTLVDLSLKTFTYHSKLVSIWVLHLSTYKIEPRESKSIIAFVKKVVFILNISSIDIFYH